MFKNKKSSGIAFLVVSMIIGGSLSVMSLAYNVAYSTIYSVAIYKNKKRIDRLEKKKSRFGKEEKKSREKKRTN